MFDDKDGVSVLRVGDQLILVITTYPTVHMTVLDKDRATDLAEGLLRTVVTEDQADNVDDMLAGVMKKAKGEPS